MDTNNPTLQVVDDSNNVATQGSETATTPTPTPEKVSVKALITAIGRGQSEETKDQMFFRSNKPIFPKTDENGLHSVGYSFGKGVQCMEDILSLFPNRIKSAYKKLTTDENKLTWLDEIFQSLTNTTFIVEFTLIAANEIYRSYQKPYAWYAATNVTAKTPNISAEDIAYYLEEAKDLRSEEKSAAAQPAEWTTFQPING